MKVVFVQGPTASGKSNWALDFAQEFQGAIINCDSVQAYQGPQIGSAAPSLSDMQKVPHYLYQYVQYPQELTVGNYTRDFFQCLETLKVSVVFVVGGTGFYFQALEKGLFPVLKVPDEIKQSLIAELAQEGARERLYLELRTVDPESAEEVHINDSYRLLRALEVYRAFGKPFSAFRKEFEAQAKPFPYPLLKIGLRWPRETLRGRIAERTRLMLEQGLIQETEELLKSYPSTWSPLESVGYKEVVDYLEKRLAREKLPEAISIATSQLAKRQMTWFQRDSEILWYDASTEKALARKSVEDFLKK